MLAKRFKLFIALVFIAAAVTALFVWLSRERPVNVIVKKADTGAVQ